MALHWFFAGAGMGILHVMTLWWTVSALRPEKMGPALMLVWGGALLRCIAVVALMMAAVNQALDSCLLACAGFLVARWVVGGMIGQRLATTARALPK